MQELEVGQTWMEVRDDGMVTKKNVLGRVLTTAQRLLSSRSEAKHRPLYL